MAFLTVTYDYNQIGTTNALSVVDVALSVVLFFILFFILMAYKNTKKEQEYRYFLPFFLFKFILLLAFVALYIYYYGGGDSTAFWAGANSLVDLSLQDFPAFLREFFSSDTTTGAMNEFMTHNIRYPSWIIREQEGYFTSKIYWFFNLISRKNYLLTSMWFALFAFLAHWKLFMLISQHFLKNKNSKFSLFFLFIPSIAFWCTGISKDVLVFIGLLSLTRHLLLWFVLKERSVKSVLWMLFYAWLLLKVREITFALLALSFVIMWLFTIVNSLKQKSLRRVLRFLIIIFSMGGMVASFSLLGLDSLLNPYLAEAEITNQDFQNNASYTGAKYNLGITDFSIGGMIAASPLAIIAGLFRPFLWESLSATLFLNGLEGALLLYLFFINILFKIRTFFANLMENKLLLFAFIFALLFAFATGFTAIIFGVLVRLRAPLLVFLVIALFWKDFDNKQSKRVPV